MGRWDRLGRRRPEWTHDDTAESGTAEHTDHLLLISTGTCSGGAPHGYRLDNRRGRGNDPVRSGTVGIRISTEGASLLERAICASKVGPGLAPPSCAIRRWLCDRALLIYCNTLGANSYPPLTPRPLRGPLPSHSTCRMPDQSPSRCRPGSPCGSRYR